MCWKAVNCLALGVVLSACSSAPPAAVQTKQETIVFGTRVVLTVAHADTDADTAAANAAINEVFEYFEAMHRRFHSWRDGELQQLNARIARQTLPVAVSAPMAAMIRQAQEYEAVSGGLFNPAIGALVELWGFHSDVPPVRPPPPAAVADLLRQRPSAAAVRLADAQVVEAAAAVQLDFGALAKGAALDGARLILKRRGVENALINIGGNIMAMGKNGGRAWRVALALDGRESPPLVDLYDGEAVATSGVTERYFIYEGRRYHHIIDPRTGYPAQTVAAVTVIRGGRDAGAISDAAATALVVADAAQARLLLEQFNITMAWRAGDMPTDALQRRIAQ